MYAGVSSSLYGLCGVTEEVTDFSAMFSRLKSHVPPLRNRCLPEQCRPRSASTETAFSACFQQVGIARICQAALGVLPILFVSAVAMIQNVEQMFISTEMSLIPSQRFSQAAIVCEYFSVGANCSPGPRAEPDSEGNGGLEVCRGEVKTDSQACWKFLSAHVW